VAGFFLILFFIPFDAISGDLEVSITGFRNTKGQILVGVHNKESNFPEKRFEFKGIVINSIKIKY